MKILTTIPLASLAIHLLHEPSLAPFSMPYSGMPRIVVCFVPDTVNRLLVLVVPRLSA